MLRLASAILGEGLGTPRASHRSRRKASLFARSSACESAHLAMKSGMLTEAMVHEGKPPTEIVAASLPRPGGVAGGGTPAKAERRRRGAPKKKCEKSLRFARRQYIPNQ